MGRIKTAVQKLREANIARERERIISTRPVNITTTVRPRRADRFIYRAYSLRNGATQQL